MQTRRAGAVAVLWGALLLLGACRSGPGAAPGGERAGTDAGAAVASTARATAALQAPVVADGGAPDAGAPDAGPAAAALPPQDAGAAGARAACRRDADCVLTMRQEEGCCATLCVPRAVSLAQQAEEARVCTGFAEERCPFPSCAPPRWSYAAVCQAGVCTLQRGPVEDERRPRRGQP